LKISLPLSRPRHCKLIVLLSGLISIF
jgi:hypothetical protein